MYKEFLFSEAQAGSQNIGEAKPYSWPVYLFWQSVKVTFLQMFPMKGITILNFDHSHSFMDICYVLSGNGSLKLEDDKTIPLRRGTLCYINSKVVHRVISDEDSPLELYNISFELSPYNSADKVPQSIADNEEQLINCLLSSRYLCSDDCYNCEDFLRNALSTINSSVPGDFVKFKNCISNYLMSAIQAVVKLEQSGLRLNNYEDEMIQNAMQMVFYMRDHYTEGITLNDVARALNYSPRQCQRLIQDFLGVGFTEFILAHQLRHAKHLLAMTDATLEEVSKSTGFKSSKALSQQFKAIIGMTPHMYRKNYKLGCSENTPGSRDGLSD